MIRCQGLIITISNTVRWSKICTGKTSLMNRLTSQSVSRTTVLAYLLFIFSISVIKAILIVKVVIKWLLLNGFQMFSLSGKFLQCGALHIYKVFISMSVRGGSL